MTKTEKKEEGAKKPVLERAWIKKSGALCSYWYVAGEPVVAIEAQRAA